MPEETDDIPPLELSDFLVKGESQPPLPAAPPRPGEGGERSVPGETGEGTFNSPHASAAEDPDWLDAPSPLSPEATQPLPTVPIASGLAEGEDESDPALSIGRNLTSHTASSTKELDALLSATSPEPRLAPWPGGVDVLTDPAEGARRALIVGRIMVGVVTIGLAALLGRVVQLQVFPPAPIAALKGTQQTHEPMLARRGTLLDACGRVITADRFADRLFIDPQMVQDMGTFAERVGYRLGYDPAWIAKTIDARATRRYIVLDRHLNEDRLDKIGGFHLPGLGVEERVVREYPQGSLAGQVIGFVGADHHGIEGVEKVFDKELSGTPGKLTYLRDAHRHALFIDDKSYQPPVDGKSVRLSLDLIVQSIAEAELSQACKDYGAEGGEAIVMNAHTGEIMAMANYPSVDLYNYGNTKPEYRQNRCVTRVYEPGSTFKPFIWSKALEEGVFRPNEHIDCTSSGVYVFPSGRHLRDAHPSGTVTADEVLVKSSNIGMGIIGTRMGAPKEYAAMKAFGFGSPTASGLPGEIGGKVWPLNRWSKYSITSVSMGQEVSVTALQMARSFCTFANGGMLVTPTVRALDSHTPPMFERVLKPETIEHAREVLRRVVTEGTGKKADSPLYAIFGKTGTAQIAGPHGGYIPDAFVGSFVCGAPAEDPQIVVICVVHHPDRSKGHFGGTVAAPAARRIVEQTLIYLGVPPQTPDPANAPSLAQR